MINNNNIQAIPQNLKWDKSPTFHQLKYTLARNLIYQMPTIGSNNIDNNIDNPNKFWIVTSTPCMFHFNIVARKNNNELIISNDTTTLKPASLEKLSTSKSKYGSYNNCVSGFD